MGLALTLTLPVQELLGIVSCEDSISDLICPADVLSSFSHLFALIKHAAITCSFICLVPEVGLVGPKLKILVILIPTITYPPYVIIPFCASASVSLLWGV